MTGRTKLAVTAVMGVLCAVCLGWCASPAGTGTAPLAITVVDADDAPAREAPSPALEAEDGVAQAATTTPRSATRFEVFRDQFAADAGALSACGIENVSVACSGTACAMRLPAEGFVPIDYAVGTAQTVLTSWLDIPRHTVPCLAAGDRLVLAGVDTAQEHRADGWFTARCVLNVAPGSSTAVDAAAAMRAELCTRLAVDAKGWDAGMWTAR